MKRKRRTLNDLKEIRQCLLKLLRQKGRLSLSELVEEYAEELCIRNTPSDRGLLKRQLDRLDEEGLVDFVKVGRALVARNKPDVPSAILQESGKPAVREPSFLPPELAAIRAFALQLEHFSKALQAQIGVLVQMIDKAADSADYGGRGGGQVREEEEVT